MLLSFSVPAMLPYIRAGLRQRAGEDVGGERVKRQTIRKRGPRAETLLKFDRIGYTQPYDLHLYWKSRTAECELIGKIEGGSNIYPLDILHGTVTNPNGTSYPIIRIDGPRGWCSGDPMLFWSPGDGANNAFAIQARLDGFDTPEAFRDFFVPKLGDRFDGVLFKW